MSDEEIAKMKAEDPLSHLILEKGIKGPLTEEQLEELKKEVRFSEDEKGLAEQEAAAEQKDEVTEQELKAEQAKLDKLDEQFGQLPEGMDEAVWQEEESIEIDNISQETKEKVDKEIKKDTDFLDDLLCNDK